MKLKKPKIIGLKLIKPKIKTESTDLTLKTYKLKDLLKLDLSQWNIVYIPEDIKPKILKNKTLIISTFAKPKEGETFIEFMKRISVCNLAFILNESRIIHLEELRKPFQKGFYKENGYS